MSTIKVSEYSYNLPEELIAQTPLLKRDNSRMLVLDKNTGNYESTNFSSFIDYLNKGDTLVLNNTKVLPARLFGNRENKEEKIEVFLTKQLEENKWEVLVKPGKKAKIGEIIYFSNKLKCKVESICEEGERIVEFKYEGIFNEILDELGTMPLPPYITEKLDDKDRYQTVYSKEKGSVAAPTAGLHFTKELLNKIKEKEVNICYVTLHVGIGTFRPIKVDDITNHNMHSEWYSISKEVVDVINETKLNNKRVISVGTTTTRVLESCTNDKGIIESGSGETNIFIYPPYKFKMVDALLTNFHLPKSTLLMLVSAFSKKEYILNAYNFAVKEEYRFFSFGDCMFLK